MQDDKAVEFRLIRSNRPHMRAFHNSWWGFFVAFFCWFAIVPLLGDIQSDLGLSDHEVFVSNIVGVGGTILVRFILGPLCDQYGPRRLFSLVLVISSIATACTGLVQTATGLSVLRFFTGIAGGAFVTCQYWTSRMFAKEIVGSANALVGGWGNVGATFTPLVVGGALYPLFITICGGNSELAWRTVSIVPAFVGLVTGIAILYTTDDSPRGNYSELKKHGIIPKCGSVKNSAVQGAKNFNSWLLFVQYACCFGVELAMNAATAKYYRDVFGQSSSSSVAIAGIFGWLNLFARALGGFVSDWAMTVNSMRGRIWVQATLLLLLGISIIIFANTHDLAGSIIVLVFFSLFVQATEGSTFGIVPYVNPPCMGTVIGIVGAGGNAGAVAFGFIFRSLDYHTAYTTIGAIVIFSSLLSCLISIKGFAGIFWGRDEDVDKETGEIVIGETPTASSEGVDELESSGV